MIDLQDAKLVRRDELLSRASSSRSPSPQPESALQDAHQRLGKLLNIDSFLTSTESAIQGEESGQTESQQNSNDQEEEEQEFEFRLFSAPAASKSDAKRDTTSTAETDKIQKLRIRLRSPSPAALDGEGRFVNPFRGWQYYFSTPGLLSDSKVEDSAAALKRKQFEDAAITGQQLLGWATVSWPGCHLPWRVIHLKREHTKLPPDSKDPATAKTICITNPPPPPPPKSRKKPGKKRRIQLRKRVNAAEEAKQREAEKRNRKNRERKIKRRQKAREVKAAAAAASGQSQNSPDVEMDDASSQEGTD